MMSDLITMSLIHMYSFVVGHSHIPTIGLPCTLVVSSLASTFFLPTEHDVQCLKQNLVTIVIHIHMLYP